MIFEIEKEKMKNKTTFCKKCRSFLFKSKENGYLEFKANADISSNGKEFVIKCNCGETTVIKLR